ncbi:unnamed protein product [Ranitomeya imitator]|uniref:F5/8 type C domain-containing protein n=1 Tax=Ranitomeya imitator TaxID=111125 RepID=A0ABN9LWR8_9NEOB|nr:unnamed protein product [Ranitomeya imitator]
MWLGNILRDWAIYQVDLLTPMLVHSIQTQGARQRLLSIYVSQFLVFYSLNGKEWSPYQGNTSNNQMVFFGNVDSSSIRENHFDPPIIARFLQIHPTHTGARAGLRMELFGCDLNSVYYGGQRMNFNPILQPACSQRADTSGEWLQVDLSQEMKVTGLIIQGARSSFTSMYITHLLVSFSNDGKSWEFVRELNGQRKVFQASRSPDTPVWITFNTSIITRFIKLHPDKWKGGIALRMEVIGCTI